jgi:hypothetical protein
MFLPDKIVFQVSGGELRPHFSIDGLTSVFHLFSFNKLLPIGLGHYNPIAC